MPPRIPFGGNVGRRVRADGFKPNSPEALEADRAKDRERKRQANALKRAATPPPPLPAAGATANLPATGPAPDAALGGDPGFAPLGEPAPLAWQPDSLRPLFEQLIEAAEAGRVGSFVSRCTEIGVTGKLLKEIEADAGFPKAAKLLLCRALPKLAAKWLNKSGLSAEYEDEVAVVSALVLIMSNDRKLTARLDAVIAELKKPEPPEKKP